MSDLENRRSLVELTGRVAYAVAFHPTDASLQLVDTAGRPLSIPSNDDERPVSLQRYSMTARAAAFSWIRPILRGLGRSNAPRLPDSLREGL